MLCLQVADLREFEEFVDIFPDSDSLPLYQSALQKLEQDGIPYRWASQLLTAQLNLN
jgi:hypothetical protein